MRWLCAAMLVGCYAPSPTSGLPCSSGGDCPAGQSCDLDRHLCLPLAVDAAGDIIGDGPTDSFVVDPGAPWAAPQPMTAVSSTAYETDPALSPDGLELFFSSDRMGTVGGLDIYRATRAATSDAFGMPSPVAELQTTADESAAELGPDRLTIYFRRSNDIYRASRSSVGATFTNIVKDEGLSTAFNDTNPAFSGDSLVASTTREFSSLDRDLFLFSRATAMGAWSAPQPINEVNTPSSDSGAALDLRGTAMVFHSDRPGSLDSSDIYITTRPSTTVPFGSPVAIRELNTTGNESDATLDASWKILVMEREGDLYITTR
ncbi:MAG: PD40 domain-containing protein [Deltaproteobacteria bacterium]|nr:PD40 domain-containing protein [Deltaproteobacteria bacterium]